MQDDEVMSYLQANPEFFERNAALLADVHLPSPHGGGTISLAERQQLAQRDKIEAVEERYAELVLNAQDNDKISNKMHHFFILMQQAKDFDALEQLISHKLPEDFNITDTCLRIWSNPLDINNTENLVFKEVEAPVHKWVNNIHNVYCGETPTTVNLDDWFIDPAKSVAVLPLKNESTYGFLALSSDQENRFYVGMGTDFLQKLADHVSASLSRYIL